MQCIIRKLKNHRKNNEAQSIFADKKGNQWKYLIRKEYMELPEQERRICADMRKKDSGSANLLLRDGEIRSGLYQYRSKKKFSEKTIGYIPVLPVDNTGETAGDPSCIRIIGKSFVKAYIVPVLLLLLLAGLILGSFWYLKEDDIPGLDESAIAYHVEGVKNTDPSQIMMPGFGTITMDAGSTTVHAALANPEGNPCYFKYQISLSDTGDQIYESGWIEPGMAVAEWNISEELPEGEYPIYILVQTGSLENYEEGMNRGVVNATLVVR